MKKIALVVMAAGALSLAACHRAPEAAAADNNTAITTDAIDNNASMLDDMAAGSANSAAADMMANAADAMHNTADNAQETGAAKADNASK